MKVKRLRLAFVLFVVLGGMLAALNATFGISAVALLLAAELPQPHNVLPVAKAVISSAAVLIGIYLVALPLYANMPMRRFVARLEQRLGRRTYLLSALELRDQLLVRGEQGLSYPLLERIGASVLDDLKHLRYYSVRPAGLAYYLAVLFCLVLGGSLVVNMAQPDAVKKAAVRLFSTQSESMPGPSRASLPARKSNIVGPVQVPPCRRASVLISPPAYLDARPYSAPWSGRVELMAGSTVSVTCEGALPGREVLLERHLSSRTLRQPLEYRGGLKHSAPPPTTSFVARADMRLYLAVRDPAMVQPDHLELVIVEDSAPKCSLLQPAEVVNLKPTDTLTVLVEAQDREGLGLVSIFYMVKGLDPVPASIELARPDGQSRAVVQRDLPLSSFGVDEGDEVELFVEVLDTNDYSGPAVCNTRKQLITIASPHASRRKVILRLAALRGTAIDLVAAGIEAGLPSFDKEGGAPVAARVRAYLDDLEDLSGEMSSMSHFKQEDSRRVATLAATFEELIAGETVEQDHLARRLPEVSRELEQHILGLDGVTEKLVGEYLFHVSGKVQSELARAARLARENRLEPGARRDIRRTMRRLNRLAGSGAAFKARTSPAMPTLFTPSLDRGHGDWFGKVRDLSLELADSADPSAAKGWQEQFDELSRAVEMAVQSVEGAYARSMTRLSSSFRSAQLELTRQLKKAIDLNLAIRKELEALILEVEKETKGYIRQRKTIEGARIVTRTIRKLLRRERRFRASTYPEVDRGQLLEFREKLERLSQLAALLRIEEATSVAQELVSLTESMEFSLKLNIRYSKKSKLVEHSRRELDKVNGARKLVESILARLMLIRPQRHKLKSLKSQRLEEIASKLEALKAQVTQIREKVVRLSKMFPLFFGKLGPSLDRLADSLGKAQERLSELMLEETHKLAVFADETLVRLLDTLENARRNAKSASALVAGGTQPRLDIEGKAEVVSREKLERYMKQSLVFKDRQEWTERLTEYFEQLSR